MKELNKKSVYVISFIAIFLITIVPIHELNRVASKETDSTPISYLNEGPKISAINDAGPYLYVIITNNALKNSNSYYYTFQDLLESKREKGIYGIIVTVEEIYSGYNGRDYAEKIRNFIVDAYQRWDTRYILLGGDSNIIPTRYFCSGEDLPEWIPGPQDPYNFYTDQYYSAIHISWDHDNDGIYGEESDWDMILDSGNIGDVYIGRAPVGSIQEVNNFVKKTLFHEQELKYRSDVDYLYSGLMAGEFEGIDIRTDPPTLFFGADCLDQLYMYNSYEYCNANGYQTKKIPDNYHFETLYERDGTYYDGTYIHIESWTKNSLLNKIESEHGVHILNYHGLPLETVAPGGEVGVLLSSEDDAQIKHDKLMELNINDVLTLTNEKYFFLYSYQDNAFYFADEIDQNYASDVNYIHFSYDSIGERLITSNNGAFAAIGDIGIGPRGPEQRDLTDDADQEICREFYDAIFREGINEIGRALQDAKEELLRRYTETYGSNWQKTMLCTTAVLGDPMAIIRPQEESIFTDQGPYDYVIITNELLKNSNHFQDLVTLKNSQGYQTTIVTVEEIYSDYLYWRDNPERIRAFIKDAHNIWGTDYILLGGDERIIPMREFQSPLLGHQDPDAIAPIPSDQYYASLDGFWDDDNDGIYGEEEDWENYLSYSNTDDIAVGRAPVNTENQLSNFMRKTLLHEEEMGNRNDDFYLYSVLMVGEHMGVLEGTDIYGADCLDELRYNPKTNGLCINHSYYTRQFEQYYNIETLYERNAAWSKNDVISFINRDHGVHIINQVGHGNEFSFMKLDEADVNNLINDKYPFIYSGACDALGIGSIGADWINSRNGAFAIIGNTRLGGSATTSTDCPDQNNLREFYNLQLGGIDEIGRALQEAKKKSIHRGESKSFFKYWRYKFLSLNLFGDPTTVIIPDSKPSDLVPRDNIDIALSNIDVLENGNVSFTYELSSGIRNIGGTNIGGFHNHFGLWGNAGEHTLGEYDIESLGPNELKSTSCSGTITLPLGEYKIFHNIDYYDDIYELDEGNNFIFELDPLILEPGNFFPDIISRDIEITKSNIVLGENEVTFSYDISSDILNKGLLGTNEAFWIQYIAKNGESVYELGEYYIGSLNPNELKSTNCSGTITLPFGEYEIACSVDNDANVEETDETNNIYSNSYPLLVSNDILLPDFAIYNDIEFNVTPMSIQYDTWLEENYIDFFYEISFNVKNYGWNTTKGLRISCSILSRDNEVRYYLGDYYIEDGFDQNEVKQVQDKWYYELPYGSYYLELFVDTTTSLPESNKKNNIYHSNELIVFSTDEYASDFAVVDDIEYELSDIIMEEGDKISFSYDISAFVCNYGFRAFQLITADFYVFEGDNVYYLGGVDHLYYLLNNLYFASFQGNITLPFGEYGLMCIIDINNQLVDLNKDNNIYINPNSIIGMSGCMSISPVTDKTVRDTFTTQVYIDSGDQKVAAYGFNFTFDPNIVNIIEITAGPDGFISVIEIDNSNGWATVSGFDASGVGPSSSLNFLTITWKAIGAGESVLAIDIEVLVDESTAEIGTPHGINSHVTVNPLPNQNVTISPVTDKTVRDVFTTQVYIDSGSQKVAAYVFNFTFDPNIVNIIEITAGSDGFISAIEIDNSNGWALVSGFDASGVGPSSSLNFLTITWEAIGAGESVLAIDIDLLVDESTAEIGTPHGINSHVTVNPPTSILGDVNNDGFIDIVDALQTAQYYVGLNPQDFHSERADVNADGYIDIVDALLIARYYVGLIDKFPAEL